MLMLQRRHAPLLVLWLLVCTVQLVCAARSRSHRPPSPRPPPSPECRFPESEVQPFFFELASDTPPRSVVMDTVVEPPNARLQITNIRASNLPGVNFTSHFRIESRTSGQFMLTTQASLQDSFPDYPSRVNETLLYATVVCNQKAFPLITLRLRNSNSRAPEFEGEPYEVVIFKDSPVGSVFETPLLAYDEDPSPSYAISMAIVAPEEAKMELALDTSSRYTLPAVQARLGWAGDGEVVTPEQLPSIVKLRLLATPTRSVYYLNVSASDNGWPVPGLSYTQLKVLVREEKQMRARFTRREYTANFTRDTAIGSDLIVDQPIAAVFPTANDVSAPTITYRLAATEFSHLFSLDPETARLRVAERPPENTPPVIELEVEARVGGGPRHDSVTARLLLFDRTEVRLTYFTQCRYEAHLLENPSAYTRVLQFNFRGDVEGVELLNGTELFQVEDDGTMNVRPGVDIDREKTERIVIKARLKTKTTLNSKSLELYQIATADIIIDDYNDHTPQFERHSYTFYIAEQVPFNNTEVGSISATDGDSGEFGHVHYRILEDFDEEDNPLPFVLFQSDGQATIFYVVRRAGFLPRKSYSFTLEAFDSEDAREARTSRVSIHAILGEEEAARRRVEEAADNEVQSSSTAGNDQTTRSNDETTQSPTTTEPPPASTTSESETDETAGDNITPTTTSAPTSLSNRPEKPKRREKHLGNQQFAAPSFKFEASESNDVINEHDKHPIAAAKSTAEHLIDPAEVERDQHVGGETNIAKPQREGRRKKLTLSAEAGTVGPSGNYTAVKVVFDKPLYDFTLKGELGEGQYIGTIHFAAISNSTSSLPLLEYAVEEGISGFVDIDPFTGRLTVGKKLVDGDYEEIRFAVAAQTPATYVEGAVKGSDQTGRSRILATTLVSVLMDDAGSIYDLPPVFEQSLYRMEVEENRPPHRIGRVEAHHRATELGRDHVWYVLDGDNPDTANFRVDPESGWITSKRELDAEERANYRLKSEVVIVLLDDNDNPPDFNSTSAPLIIQVPVALAAGTELTRLLAKDADISERNSRVHYALRTAADLQDKLRIDPVTGVITLQGEIDTNRKVGGTFGGEVDATDEGEPPLTSTLPVQFRTANVNPHPPEFDNFRYEAEVNGSSGTIAEGTFIAQVHAFDVDEGDDGKVAYEIPAAPGNSWADSFSIDRESGAIRTNRTIKMPPPTDAHEPSIQLIVEAGDSSAVFPRRAQTVVLIRQSAASTLQSSRQSGKEFTPEEGLEFVPLPKTIFVSETKPVGSPIIETHLRHTIAGKSNMVASAQDYKFEVHAGAPRERDLFQMDGSKLVVKALLNSGEYDVELLATKEIYSRNGTGKPVARHRMHIVVIQGRDKYPVFEKLNYEFEIDSTTPAELFPVKLPPLNASISGSDGMHGISYSLFPAPNAVKAAGQHPASPSMAIDRLSGQLIIADRGFFESSTNGPTLPRDRSGTEDLSFVVIRATNVEHPAYYSDASVTLRWLPKASTSGGGEPKLSFESNLYRLIVAEGQETGSIVNTVPLRLRGAKTSNLTTALHFEPENAHFGILPNGSVVVKRPIALDQLPPDSKPLLSLNAVARDSDQTATTRVEIAIERVAGGHGSASTDDGVKIAKDDEGMNTTAGHIDTPTKIWTPKIVNGSSDHYTLAGPTQGDKWDFKIVGGNERGYFQLRKGNDSMTHLELAPLSAAVDNDQDHMEVVQVEASRSDLPNKRLRTNITVDMREIMQHKQRTADTPHPTLVAAETAPSSTLPTPTTLPPEAAFVLPRPYHFVVEKPEKDGIIGQLAVSDYDRTRYSLSIEPPEYRNWFRVDRRNAILFVFQVPGSLHGRQRAEFRVQLNKVTSDGGEERISEVPVKVDLVLPRRTTTTMTTFATNPTTTATSTSIATDASTTTAAEATATPTGNTRTSAAVVGEDATLHTQPPSSSTRTATTTAAIQNVTLPPILSKTPDETAKAAETVRPTSSLSMTTPAAVSTPTTSPLTTLTVVVSTTLVQTTPFSTTAAEVSTTPMPTTSTAPKTTSTTTSSPPQGSTTTTVVTSIPTTFSTPQSSTSAPAFTYQVYRAMLPEGNYGNRGALVSLRPEPLRQSLPDDPSTSFEIDSPHAPLPFYIRNNTGELIAFAEIDREASPRYEFVVRARGHVIGERRARVIIDILDVNDNTPRFVDPPHAVAVDRSAVPGTVLARFHAIDGDDGREGHVTYSVIGAESLFVMNAESGELTLANAIPSDLPDDTLRATIVASDGGRPSLKSTLELRIDIFDGEPGQPRFKGREYNASNLGAGAGGGAFVMQVLAGVGANFTYALEEQSRSGLFAIDPTTGIISLAREPLPSERNRNYTLEVSATRSGSNADGGAHTTLHVILEGQQRQGEESSTPLPPVPLPPTTTPAAVKLRDENKHAPYFIHLNSEGVYVFVVDWQTAVLQRVAQVQARDDDGDSRLNYSLTHSLADDHFSINRTTGAISLMTPLTNLDEEVFHMEASVSDGAHETRVPVDIYKLQPGSNIVLLTTETPATEVNETAIVRNLSTALGVDVRVLARQIFIDSNGHVNPRRSMLLIFALHPKTRVPVNAETLKEMLDRALVELQRRSPVLVESMKLSNVTLPYGGSQRLRLSMPETVLLGISGLLLMLACCLLLILLRCCRKKQQAVKAELEYMVGSESAGPRPYNVELITRRAAQSVLASSRPLPGAHEEVTMTPESRQSMITTSGIYPMRDRDATSTERADLSSVDSPPTCTHRPQAYESTSSESLNGSEAAAAHNPHRTQISISNNHPQQQRAIKTTAIPAVSVKSSDE